MNTHTIMVVEDMPIVRNLLITVLRAAGYQVIGAPNGKDALRLLDIEHVDLILLDLIMPIMDGLTFLQFLRHEHEKCDLPVIVLTVVMDHDRIARAAKLGIHDYLLKTTFSPEQLQERIVRCLGPPAPSGTPAKNGTATGAPCPQPRLAAPPSPAPDTTSSSAAASSPAAMPPPPTTTNPSYAAVPVPAVAADLASHAEALRALRPAISRSDLLALIDKGGELKGFSPAVAEVLRITGSSQCAIERVAKAISQDHAIALKILRLANSVLYRCGEPVDSVPKAILRIGLEQIRQTVLNIAVVERFSSGIEDFIHGPQFWEHSMATGILCAEIARERGEKEADTAFTIGLLHDVGRMVYVSQLRETYCQVLQTARQYGLPLEQVEQRMLGFNHADILDRVFQIWNFPTQFTKPIASHHLSAGNIRNTETQAATEIATLALADRLAHAFMLGSSGNDTIYPTEELCELLRIDPQLIARCEQTLREQTDGVKLAMLASSAQDSWPQLRDVHRQSLRQPFRPLYVSTSPHFDAHRIFCEQLADWSQDDKPNIGILHVRLGREQVPLTEQYRSKEAQAEVGSLPLLLISPTGKICPENSLLAGRRFAPLATPITIPTFVAAVNQVTCDAELPVRQFAREAA